ncbi:MAG: DNA-binding response regulator [Oceanospirillaceae bacterium]|nr:DNA-binding response regulator [Oceanospirillaceae bacterium]
MTTPRVLVVDDQPQNLDILISYLARSELQLSVATCGKDALELAEEQRPDLILLDVMMPDLDGFDVCRQLKQTPHLAAIPIIFMSALSDSDSRVKGFNVGGSDYVPKPLYREEVLARIQAQLTIVQQRRDLEARNQQLEHINSELQKQIDLREQAEVQLSRTDAALTHLSRQEAERWGIDAFVGQSPTVIQLLEQIQDLQHAAATNVLVLGESGTGKELVSRALHFGSVRRQQPFIAVNCSSIPAELADAEFFGHTKGAYTGATSDRRGFFEQAHGGTLFLDEIGDMPFTLQAKLLRVLEDGLVTPVGGTRANLVDVRVVAATNVNLQQRVQAGEFRQDLYFRLAGYVLALPPLRERASDIPLLANHFLRKLGEQMGREAATISVAAMQEIQSYHFPGNVRELRNLVEFALIASRGEPIQNTHLHFMEGHSTASPQAISSRIEAGPAQQTSTASHTPETDDETRLLQHTLQQGRMDNATAQRLLGIDHGRASYLLKKLHKEGKLTKQGERRWAYYEVPQ